MWWTVICVAEREKFGPSELGLNDEGIPVERADERVRPETTGVNEGAHGKLEVKPP